MGSYLRTRETSASWWSSSASDGDRQRGCTVPAAFAASETFDVGIDLGSPASPGYFDRRPFRFIGKIETVRVKLLK